MARISQDRATPVYPPTIIAYVPTLQIVNAEQLPRGVGAPYLECMTAHTGVLVAMQWRRKPLLLPRGRVLVKIGA